MTAPPMLAIAGLCAGYPRRRVIDGLTLPPLPAATLTAVLGPNGAGKTTLLRALAGLLPAAGTARYDGRDLLRCRTSELARLVAYMPQALPQGIALTVIEAVITALQAMSPTHEWATGVTVHARAEAVLARLGIADLASAWIDELSGGQRQLLSLAQSIARQPAVLLLDEPTSALDPAHQIGVMEAVREAAARDGMIVLAVLHDINLALRWADRVVLLRDGALVTAGGPAQAVTAESLAAAYRVAARVEPCSRGRLHVQFDGRLD